MLRRDLKEKMKAKIKVANGYYILGEIEVELVAEIAEASRSNSDFHVAPVYAIIPNDGRYKVENNGELFIETKNYVDRDGFKNWKKERGLK